MKNSLEARSLQPNMKATLLSKLREYKPDLNKLKREVKKLAVLNSTQATQEELLESGLHGASANQRDRLVMSTERHAESTNRLRESRRAILETEELGVSILEDLQQQRETLLHSHKKSLISFLQLGWRWSLSRFLTRKMVLLVAAALDILTLVGFCEDTIIVW